MLCQRTLWIGPFKQVLWWIYFWSLLTLPWSVRLVHKELCAVDLRSVHLVLGSSVSLVFSLSLSWGHFHSWGLGFLHGICMTGWVDSTHTSHTVIAYHIYASAASFHPFWTYFPRLCVCFLFVCCIVFSPVLGSPTFYPPPAFLFPLSCPLLIKTF